MLRLRALCLLGALVELGCADLIGVQDWSTAGGYQVTSDGGLDGGAGGCWAADPAVWTSVEPAALDALGPEVYDPMLSPDGLTLHYMQFTPGGDAGTVERPFRATRSDRGATFGTAMLLAEWPESVANAWVGADERELIADNNDDLLAATSRAGVWQDPQKLGTAVNSGSYDRNASLTADGTHMVFERQDGEQANVIGTAYRLHEAVRPAPAAPGDAFGASAPLSLPPSTDGDVLFCATLSPDGLRLFFGSTHPLVLSDANKNGALTVWLAERDALDAPWGEAIHVAALDRANVNSCPSTVTDDGCEVWVVRSDFAGTYEIDVAKRAP